MPIEYHATFDADGFPVGFYPSDVWEIPPSDAVPITPSQYRELREFQGLRRWNGSAVVTYVPPPPPPVLLVVSASQAKIALYNAGLLEQVKTLVGSHPYEPVRIWYADANQWEQGHAFVQALGSELGLNDADIAVLFKAASLL